MDPNSDLPPITSDHVAGDPNLRPPPSNHALPPYAEMIIAAITALKDKDGSSRQAISKYIEKEYPNLPPTHSSLLTHHLKLMKNSGQLMMVKHSYMLPARSVPFQPPTSATGYHPSLDFGGGSSNVTDGGGSTGTGTGTGGNGENSVGLLKRKPGRPPKLRPDAGFVVQEPLTNARPFDAEVPPYQPQFQYNVGVGQDFQTQAHLGGTGQELQLQYGSGSGSEFQGNSGGGAEPLFASLGLGDDGVVVPSPPPAENTLVVAKRGRGRPPKAAGGGSGGFDGAGSGGDGAGSGSGGDVAGEIQGNKTGSGRPVRKPKMMSVLMGTNGGRVKKGRGRPRKIGIGPVTVPLSGNVLRPRGRPKRAVGRPVRSTSNVAVNGGVSDSGLASRRSGRPSINSGANNIAKLTGKPVGRPSKIGSGTAVLVTDPRQLVVYQELKNKYELLQSKVKQVTSVVKPCIDPNYGNAALGALQELEALAGADANSSSNMQIQEPVSFH